MNLGQAIRGGVKWLLLGNIGQRFLSFAFGVALARLLLPSDFGMLVTIGALTGLAGMVMSGGMGQSLIRAKEANDNDFNAVFTMQLSMSVAIFLGFFFSAPLIGPFFNDPRYVDLIRVSSLVFLMRPFSFMRNAWLTREMDFKKRSITGLISGTIAGTSGVVMAWAGMGVWSLILSGLLAAFSSNVLLALITPLRIHLNFDFSTMRKHSGYGFKITVNDFLSYLTRESKNLILSKLAGPSFLGLFNKSESLGRITNDVMMPAVMQPLFRGMGKIQDDLDQTKYMFYKVITLLMVYTTPFYVILWWVAGPFIEVVYGPKWVDVIEPLRIFVVAGIFFNIKFPCSVLLQAQNRLTQEMVVLVIQLVIVSSACLVGLRWGLEGVATGIVISHVFNTAALYYLVSRVITIRLAEIIRVAAPGLILNTLLFIVMSVIHVAIQTQAEIAPALYLFAMAVTGVVFYGAAFLFLPIPSIRDEAKRWRQKLIIKPKWL